MSPQQIQTVISVFCLIYLTFEVVLVLLNMKHVKGNEGVPELLQNHFDDGTWKRSQEYTLVKARFELVQTCFNGIVLLILANTTVLGLLENLIPFVTGGLFHSVAYVLLVVLCLSFLNIPFKAYKTFAIESRFGFNTMTLRLWLVDLLKSLLLSLVLMAPLLFGLFWFVQVAGQSWWLYAWGFVAFFQLAVLFIYPVLIAPLFNTFTPLSEGSLKERLDSLASELRFKTAGIFVMDGSTRSKHGNAYFTGFGNNKRIVLFDTLLDSLQDREIAAVLAHEIGHEKLNHIKKSVLLSLLFLAAGLWMVAQLMLFAPLYEPFGFAAASAHAALVLFLLFSEPIFFFVSPLTSVVSRVFEYQADRFAVDAVNSAEPLQRALLGLSRKSLANLTPHPWYSFFHYSHPTLVERYVAMEEYASSRG